MKKEIYNQAHENRESQERLKKCYDAFHEDQKEKDGKTRVIVNNKTCWLDNQDFESVVNTLDNLLKVKDIEFESIGEKDSVTEGLTFQQVITKIKVGEEYTQILAQHQDLAYIKISMNESEGLRIGAYLKDEPLDLPFESFRLDNLRFKQTKVVKKISYRESKFIF